MKLSTSFLQNQKHETKSDRFVTVQPAAVAEVLKSHGFDLVGLKTGKGRVQSRLNHQTTIARYRSNDNFAIQGLNMDIMFKIPHLTGKIEGRLGFFRGVCANQWNAGELFGVVKLAHTGDVIQELDRSIPELVAQREEMIEQIRVMQARQVTEIEMRQLAQVAAQARLTGAENVSNVQSDNLLIARRLEDRASADLFTVVNVIQENLMRTGIQYTTTNVDKFNRPITRNMVSRKINENSVKAVELNSKLWDAAALLVA